MKENRPDPIYKSLIEVAKCDSTIMTICYHEYVGNYGKPPPEGWKPSDEEVFAVIETMDFEFPDNNTNMEIEDIELDDETVSIDDIAQSICEEALDKFKKFIDMDTTDEMHSLNIYGISIYETKSNTTECQNMIDFIKEKVRENYSELFNVKVERNEWGEEEKASDDEIGCITITLEWGKIYADRNGA